ncbi:hypothetical protein C453_19285 [Haloferax elongans ATCC BAA-1513]|uniref:DUF2178 domain-containing protein n=1 Tax=Haloferax elongans ATCC BAA-1513 TaxID=1230453 RepID=M0H8W6_HALEO|nr:DUF2178 domain-containing protein [Haloferax elongans]ELZ80253.1 hypothetical protein C453_19285 [Haloferax elongans ATCC BAA-1513]
MSNPNTQSRERSYRRLYAGLWLLSGVALAAFITLGYPIIGVIAFVVSATVAIAIVRRYDGPLFDERDRSRQAAASQRTVAIVGISSAIVFPTVTALWALDVVAWPVWLTPIAFFVAALSFVHLGSTLYETTQVA